MVGLYSHQSLIAYLRVAVPRMPLKELIPQLDPVQFAQVHRSVVVNLRAISHVTLGDRQATLLPSDDPNVRLYWVEKRAAAQ